MDCGNGCCFWLFKLVLNLVTSDFVILKFAGAKREAVCYIPGGGEVVVRFAYWNW